MWRALGMRSIAEISSYEQEMEVQKIKEIKEVCKKYDERLNQYILGFLRNTVPIGTTFAMDYLQGYNDIFTYRGITDDGFVKMEKFIDWHNHTIYTFEPKFILRMKMEVKHES